MRVVFYTNEDMSRAARRRLAQGPWDDLAGGTESETSLRRNAGWPSTGWRCAPGESV